MNPQGQILAMEEDGLVLTESLAITLHIARRHGGPLGPANDAELALMEQWALFAATSPKPRRWKSCSPRPMAPPNPPEGTAVIAVAAEKLRRPLARLQGHLAAHSHMVGDRFTVADINTAECSRYAGPPQPAGRIPGGEGPAGSLPVAPRLPVDVGGTPGRTRISPSAGGPNILRPPPLGWSNGCAQ